MIRLHLPLCGPILDTLELIRKQIAAASAAREGLAALAWGDPGNGKSHALNLLALELTGNKFAIEEMNGQDVTAEVVRQWRNRQSGNLFSKWTVKRIDELDRASDAAQAALLTYLDYLPPHYAILATTNKYREMTRVDKGRLPRRFKQFQVAAPVVSVAAEYLAAQFGLPPAIAQRIALGARPEGELDGVNMGSAVEDTLALLAARTPTPDLALAA